MKFKVPWPLTQESVVEVVIPSILVFYENHKKKCPLKKLEQSSKCGLVETSS